jgi:ABC-type sugar transport system permease subunit
MVYKTAFRFSQFGYAASMAVALLVLVMFFSAAITRAFRASV